MQRKRPNTATSPDRFWSRVDASGGPDACWIWLGPRTPDGYGNASCRAIRPGTMGAHRVARFWTHGEVPGRGLHIDHLCRTRLCVNPTHLEVVTPRENVMRGVGVAAQWAARTHCDAGHAFSEENTYVRAGGSRACRQCHADYQRRQRSAAS